MLQLHTTTCRRNSAIVAIRRRLLRQLCYLSDPQALKVSPFDDAHAFVMPYSGWQNLGLAFLEHCRFEAVALQQFVKLRSVALRKLRRLGDVSPGHLPKPRKVIAFARLARLLA